MKINYNNEVQLYPRTQITLVKRYVELEKTQGTQNTIIFHKISKKQVD